MPETRFLMRPIWKDWILWVWLIALPVSFQATYWWKENLGDGVESARSWAIQIAGVWLTVTVVLAAVAWTWLRLRDT